MKVEIYHNVHPDNFFGLNSTFEDGSKGYLPRTHPLVKVFRYVEQPGHSSTYVLARAWEAFNMGSGQENPRYFARRLRSLSVGDVVVIDGEAFSCEGVGWRHRAPDELLILGDVLADPAIRQRVGLKPHDELVTTVPWTEGDDYDFDADEADEEVDA